MKIKKKSEVVEARFIVDKHNYNDVKHEIKDDDIVKIVDEEDESVEEEEPIVERAIITKRDLIKIIKENHNAKK